MVSHNLDEVLQLADRVTVLRDGAVAADGLPTAGLTEHDLARHMLGKAVGGGRPPGSGRPGASEVAAGSRGCALDGHDPFSFEVRAGEVVGLTGLPGIGFEAGRPARHRAAARPRAGPCTTRHGEGRPGSRPTCARCMRAGVALVPGEARSATGSPSS